MKAIWEMVYSFTVMVMGPFLSGALLMFVLLLLIVVLLLALNEIAMFLGVA